jgi:hypothetical protein
MGAARLFTSQGGGDEDAGEGEEVSGFQIVNGYAFNVGVVEGV